jgi:hypothetical protein
MAHNRGNRIAAEREAAADYLTSMLEELLPVAQQSGLEVVAFLLDMALAEAKMAVDQVVEPRRRLR